MIFLHTYITFKWRYQNVFCTYVIFQHLKSCLHTGSRTIFLSPNLNRSIFILLCLDKDYNDSTAKWWYHIYGSEYVLFGQFKKKKMWHRPKQFLSQIVPTLQMRFPNIVVILHNLRLIHSVRPVTSNISIKKRNIIHKYIFKNNNNILIIILIISISYIYVLKEFN